MRKLTIYEVESYLDLNNPLSLRGARLSVTGEHNHLIYRVEKDGRTYAIRMVNPENYRAGEWIGVEKEFEILGLLEHTRLGPQVHYLDRHFSPPLLIQEFVEATCFNDLKPLSADHLQGAARAIAELNTSGVTPDELPFLLKYEERGFRGRGLVWGARLADALRRKRRRDVLKWVLKITPVVTQAWRVLLHCRDLFSRCDFAFHFDGAHCGNTYWRDGKVVFLDWQKVSWRDDPSFTLVRFATSAGDLKGVVSEQTLDTLIEAYLEVHEVRNFSEMARARLLERQVSDLVWVLWDYTRREDTWPVEEATSVVQRYEEAKKLLAKY